MTWECSQNKSVALRRANDDEHPGVAARLRKVSSEVTAGARALEPRNIMADEVEDITDPKPELEEMCKPRCVKQWLAYQACVKRVEEDDTGVKHCTGQYLDFWHCLDKCASRRLFDRLK